jgi:sodium-dependent phosphate cotransporter
MPTTPGAQRTAPAPKPSSGDVWLRILIVLGLLFIFLVGVTGLGAGFKALGKSALDSFFAATDNPFVGLTVGILGTTLAQSSSVSTSMIVGLVAAGQLDVGNAVPMIMGANIGTTVTNTIVSLGHITRPEEFRRAFAAATCHDFFNFMTVAIMLPLELATGVLEKTASTIAVAIAGTSGGKFPNPLKDATKAALEPLVSLLEAISDSERFVAIGLIVLSIALIFVTLGFIVKTLRAVASERMESIVARSLGHNVYTGLIVGVIVTIMVQSSSITTSVMVPLAGAGLIRLEQVFPITVGANIGTTVTALIASLAAPPETLHLALTIALVHLLFNVAGVLLVFVTPQTRQIPLRAARWLADVAVRSRKYALLYVVLLFYGVPALLIFLPKLF